MLGQGGSEAHCNRQCLWRVLQHGAVLAGTTFNGSGADDACKGKARWHEVSCCSALPTVPVQAARGKLPAGPHCVARGLVRGGEERRGVAAACLALQSTAWGRHGASASAVAAKYANRAR